MKSKIKELKSLFSLDNVFSHLPGVIFWQDLNFVFHGCNEAAAELFGFKSVDKMIGKTPLDFQCKAVESAPEYMKLDIKSRQTENLLQALIVDTFSENKTEGYFVKKFPIYEGNTVIGVLTQGIPLNSRDYLLEAGGYIAGLDFKNSNPKNYCYTLENQADNFNLSERENICLFYFIRGKTTREIANILSLSPRTIEFHIDKIKGKMNCRTKSELIEMAIENGYMSFIPLQLLSSRLILVF